MPITRMKSKTIQDTTDGFYISTDPEHVIQNPLNQGIVADRKTSNTNKDDKKDCELRDNMRNQLQSDENSLDGSFVVTQNSEILQSDSDSDLESSISKTIKHGQVKQYDTSCSEERLVNETKSKVNTRKRKFQYSEAAEKSLEQFLFGKSSTNLSVKRKVNSESESSSDQSSDGEDEADEEQSSKVESKAIDEKRLSEESSSGDDESDETEEQRNAIHPWETQEVNISTKDKRKPAWHDQDDDQLQVRDVTATFTKAKGKHGGKETSTENYALSLRRKFNALKDKPKWADIESRLKNEDEDSDDEFFRETTDMLDSGKRLSLEKGFLEFRKLKDMNEETHNEGTVIRAAEFHPSASVGLVAGLNGTASLFQIDGKSNPKMQTVNFENFPVKTAHFTADGKQFIVGSQHFGHFFMYDMIAGKTVRVPWKEDGQGSVQKFEVSPAGDVIAFHGRFGNIHFFSPKTRTKIFTLKMNDDITSCAFSPDGDLLYSHGTGGEVYVWDIRAQDCIHRFWDDGCVQGTAIAVSRNNRYISTGSNSGVVNVYNRSQILVNTKPKPEKIVLNLTTHISQIKFNPTSEILAMTSEVKENAIRMLHLPSMTVFQNFPPVNYNLRRPNCMDFSINGGYFSVGNNRGAANLFRLKYFGNY